MTDLVFLSASRLAKAIRDKEASAVEVLEAHLGQVARQNPRLNAIVTLDEERARQRAREADEALARGETWGPLHGVPVTIKDSFETAGLRTTSSYGPLARYVPQQDAAVVARLRAAGAIVLGKTNMPVLAGDYQSNNRLFGRAKNPWDLARTPGGSTGGGAAAVAAGLSPLELGSDIAGSVRLPAHFCGIYALKPTEHRVSTAGHIPPLPGAPKTRRHLICAGPLARSLEDLRLFLSATAGPGGYGEFDEMPLPLDTPRELTLRDRRFAWTDDFGGVPVTPDTREVLERLAGGLARLSCRVERASPAGFDFKAAWSTCSEISATERHAAGSTVTRLVLLLGAAPIAATSPMGRGFFRGLRLSARLYLRALEQRDILARQLEKFLEDWDAWICPVASVPAFKHRGRLGLGRPLGAGNRPVAYEMAASAHNMVFNLTGHPVVVIPAGRSKEGLPIGVQLVGRRWREMDLLAVAEQVSAEATEGYQRPPGY